MDEVLRLSQTVILPMRCNLFLKKLIPLDPVFEMHFEAETEVGCVIE